jgi:hypothetical protein
MEKDGEARQATDDDTICYMCFACWITVGPDKHSEYKVCPESNAADLRKFV